MAIKQKLLYKITTFLGGGYPTALVKRRYRIRFGKRLDFANPKDFNEKILWLEKNWQNPLIVECADKYRLRDYIKRSGIEVRLPKVYGAWTDAAKVDWSSLPERFVIKCNHGAKWNIICTDKANFDAKAAEKKLAQWLLEDYGEKELEVHYSHIKPIIFAEEYIEPNSDRLMPDDYKLYCFNGVPRLVLVCLERETSLGLEWYDLDWNVMDIGAKPNLKKAKRPESLPKMIELAKALSAPFPYVRVDFYDREGEPILGELTFTPMYGMAKYYSEQGNKFLGNMLMLPKKYNGNFK